MDWSLRAESDAGNGDCVLMKHIFHPIHAHRIPARQVIFVRFTCPYTPESLLIITHMTTCL